MKILLILFCITINLSAASYTTSFDDPAENPLSESGVWEQAPGAHANGIRKTGGSARNINNADFSCARYAGLVFSSNQYVESVLDTVSGGVFIGIFSRLQSASNASGYFLELHNAGSELIMYRVDDTGSVAFVELGARFPVTISLPDTLKLTSSNSVHEVFWNGVSQGTRIDATYTGGQPGLGGYVNDSQFMLWSEWSGGDLSDSFNAKISSFFISMISRNIKIGLLI